MGNYVAVSLREGGKLNEQGRQEVVAMFLIVIPEIEVEICYEGIERLIQKKGRHRAPIGYAG